MWASPGGAVKVHPLKKAGLQCPGDPKLVVNQGKTAASLHWAAAVPGARLLASDWKGLVVCTVATAKMALEQLMWMVIVMADRGGASACTLSRASWELEQLNWCATFSPAQGSNAVFKGGPRLGSNHMPMSVLLVLIVELVRLWQYWWIRCPGRRWRGAHQHLWASLQQSRI